MPEQFHFQLSDLDVLKEKSSLLDTLNPSGKVRSIVTFMRRIAPMSTAQIEAQTQFSHLRIDEASALSQPCDPKGWFANPSLPLILEVGFGMGQSLVSMAHSNPSTNYLGLEVHIPGVGQCMYDAGNLGLNNLKVCSVDAIELLELLPDNYLDGFQLYFPDPWQKRKHYKRRFVVPSRMALVTSKLKPNGVFHAATDWEHYAYWMMAVLSSQAGLVNNYGAGNFAPRPSWRPVTKFEKRGLDAGHLIHDLLFSKG